MLLTFEIFERARNHGTTLYTVCTVPWGCSIVGYLEYRGGYLEGYLEGCSSSWGYLQYYVGCLAAWEVILSTMGDILSTVGYSMIHEGDIISTTGDVQCPTFFMFSKVCLLSFYPKLSVSSMPRKSQHVKCFP